MCAEKKPLQHVCVNREILLQGVSLCIRVSNVGLDLFIDSGNSK